MKKEVLMRGGVRRLSKDEFEALKQKQLSLVEMFERFQAEICD